MEFFSRSFVGSLPSARNLSPSLSKCLSRDVFGAPSSKTSRSALGIGRGDFSKCPKTCQLWSHIFDTAMLLCTSNTPKDDMGNDLGLSLSLSLSLSLCIYTHLYRNTYKYIYIHIHLRGVVGMDPERICVGQELCGDWLPACGLILAFEF